MIAKTRRCPQRTPGFKIWGDREPHKGQKDSAEGIGTLANGLLEIRTEHFHENKITCVKCLLRVGRSLLGLAVRTDYLGKSIFSGVWEEEARLQCKEIEPVLHQPGEKGTHRSSLIVSGLELGMAWLLVLDVGICDPKTLCCDTTKLFLIRSLLHMPVFLQLIEILRLFLCFCLLSL